MKHRQSGDTQETAAVKAGISIRSGRRIEKGERQGKQVRHWRTRKDPIGSVWKLELVPLLETEPDLTGLTLWEYLDEHYPGQYPYKLLRTLQRRVKHWRATQGPDKAVIFRQSIPAGHQGLSDFTHPDEPITLAGKPFEHLLYQFRLAHSGWRHVQPTQGGESYSALADGLQNALHKAGGAPYEHRTDSLSAAYVNNTEKQSLTRAYEALCEHYQMIPTTNNLGISHENGAIETAHGSFKHRLSQQLKLRGNNDFSNLQAYQQFLDKITDKLNKRSQSRFLEEQKQLKPLPLHRFMDYSELSVKVTSSSTISVKRGLYTVPSRLVGETLRIHLYHDRLIGFVSQTQVFRLPRIYPEKPEGRARCINYHHIIHALSAKPQAFRFSRFREDILPSESYRQLWGLAQEQFAIQDACKWIVSVLRVAHDYDCEEHLASTLLEEARQAKLPDLKQLQQRYLKTGHKPAIPLRQHSVTDYDRLLSGQWLQQEVAHV